MTEFNKRNGETKDRSTLYASTTTCAQCGRVVGLLTFRDQSQLFDGPIDTDGLGNLVVTIHRCSPRPGGGGEAGVS